MRTLDELMKELSPEELETFKPLIEDYLRREKGLDENLEIIYANLKKLGEDEKKISESYRLMLENISKITMVNAENYRTMQGINESVANQRQAYGDKSDNRRITKASLQ